MINLIGMIGAFFFAICAIPQVWHVWKTNDTKSLSMAFVLMWVLGEAITWIYIILDNYRLGVIQYPLHINYAFNGICVGYLFYKKLREPK